MAVAGQLCEDPAIFVSLGKFVEVDVVADEIVDRKLEPSTARSLRRFVVNVIALWLFCKFGSSMIMLAPGPWGPTVGGVLPDGQRIAFKSRFYGRETDDVLLVTPPGGAERIYAVNNIHAARISSVRIARDADGKRVWLESRGVVVGSLDLATDEFRPEGTAPLEWAKLGGGVTVAEGGTRGWWQYVVPW